MITDLLKFTIKEGLTADAAELMKRAMTEDLGDEGCLMAKAFLSKTNTNEIFILLGWENQEAIDKHLATDHDLKFREDLDPLLAGPPEFYDWETIA
jgi:quinol monooxygenase YgiN